jgi:hypothetical protein
MNRFAFGCCAGVLAACFHLGHFKPAHADPPPAESKPAETKPAEPIPAEAPSSPASAVPSPASPGDDQIRLHLMDGAVIAGKLTVSEIEVDTDFGKLTVPVVRIRKLRPGLSSHPQLDQRVKELVEELGAAQFDRRETAQRELLKLGLPARRELEQRQDDRDTERRTRIKTILAELDQREESSADDQEDDAGDKMPQHDSVETTEFTIVGRIVPKEFTIDSPYGRLNVKLSDIRNAERDIDGKPEMLRKSLAVEGAHLVHTGLKDSQIQLAKGDKVTITATGTIGMTPWGNRAFSTPDGAANFGWYQENQIANGALVAKISDNGPIFKVGSKLSFTADRGGSLRFAIAMQQNHGNQAFQGQYNLKVVVRRK